MGCWSRVVIIAGRQRSLHISPRPVGARDCVDCRLLDGLWSVAATGPGLLLDGLWSVAATGPGLLLDGLWSVAATGPGLVNLWRTRRSACGAAYQGPSSGSRCAPYVRPCGPNAAVEARQSKDSSPLRPASAPRTRRLVHAHGDDDAGHGGDRCDQPDAGRSPHRSAVTPATKARVSCSRCAASRGSAERTRGRSGLRSARGAWPDEPREAGSGRAPGRCRSRRPWPLGRRRGPERGGG